MRRQARAIAGRAPQAACKPCMPACLLDACILNGCRFPLLPPSLRSDVLMVTYPRFPNQEQAVMPPETPPQIVDVSALLQLILCWLLSRVGGGGQGAHAETPPQIVGVSAAATAYFVLVARGGLRKNCRCRRHCHLVAWMRAALGIRALLVHALPAAFLLWHSSAAVHAGSSCQLTDWVLVLFAGTSVGVEDARRASKEAVMRLGASRRGVQHPAHAVSLLVHYLSRRLPLPLNTKSIPRATTLPGLPLTAISRFSSAGNYFQEQILHPSLTRHASSLHPFHQ